MKAEVAVTCSDAPPGRPHVELLVGAPLRFQLGRQGGAVCGEPLLQGSPGCLSRGLLRCVRLLLSLELRQGRCHCAGRPMLFPAGVASLLWSDGMHCLCGQTAGWGSFMGVQSIWSWQQRCLWCWCGSFSPVYRGCIAMSQVSEHTVYAKLIPERQTA